MAPFIISHQISHFTESLYPYLQFHFWSLEVLVSKREILRTVVPWNWSFTLLLYLSEFLLRLPQQAKKGAALLGGWSYFTFHFHALEKEMATYSSVLAWRIPGMGEPGGLPSMGSHRVRHDWSDLAAKSLTLVGQPWRAGLWLDEEVKWSLLVVSDSLWPHGL